jgi:hypothetical protein
MSWQKFTYGFYRTNEQSTDHPSSTSKQYAQQDRANIQTTPEMPLTPGTIVTCNARNAPNSPRSRIAAPGPRLLARPTGSNKDPPPRNATTSGGVADRANRRAERAQIYPEVEGGTVGAGSRRGAANLDGPEARDGAVHGRRRLLRSGSTGSSPAARRVRWAGGGDARGMGWRQAVRQVVGDDDGRESELEKECAYREQERPRVWAGPLSLGLER